MTNNSPYCKTEIKIKYASPNEKWFLSGLILNDSQSIKRINGNSAHSFGHLLTFITHSKMTLNSSSFIGNNKPDSLHKMHYFHNFHGLFPLDKQWRITVELDMGAEQKGKRQPSVYHLVYPLYSLQNTYLQIKSMSRQKANSIGIKKERSS